MIFSMKQKNNYCTIDGKCGLHKGEDRVGLCEYAVGSEPKTKCFMHGDNGDCKSLRAKRDAINRLLDDPWGGFADE